MTTETIGSFTTTNSSHTVTNDADEKDQLVTASASGFVEAHIKIIEPVVTEQYIDDLLDTARFDENDSGYMYHRVGPFVNIIKSNSKVTAKEETKQINHKSIIICAQIFLVIFWLINIYTGVLLIHNPWRFFIPGVEISVGISLLISVFVTIAVREYKLRHINDLLTENEWKQYHTDLVSNLVKYALSSKAVTTLADGKYKINPLLNRNAVFKHIENATIDKKEFLDAHYRIMNELGYIVD